jgi:hypothetical protein
VSGPRLRADAHRLIPAHPYRWAHARSYGSDGCRRTKEALAQAVWLDIEDVTDAFEREDPRRIPRQNPMAGLRRNQFPVRSWYIRRMALYAEDGVLQDRAHERPRATVGVGAARFGADALHCFGDVKGIRLQMRHISR